MKVAALILGLLAGLYGLTLAFYGGGFLGLLSLGGLSSELRSLGTLVLYAIPIASLVGGGIATSQPRTAGVLLLGSAGGWFALGALFGYGINFMTITPLALAAVGALLAFVANSRSSDVVDPNEPQLVHPTNNSISHRAAGPLSSSLAKPPRVTHSGSHHVDDPIIDYRSILGDAVAKLKSNTVTARAELYERARRVVEEQGGLSDAPRMNQQRSSLEAAILAVEAHHSSLAVHPPPRAATAAAEGPTRRWAWPVLGVALAVIIGGAGYGYYVIQQESRLGNEPPGPAQAAASQQQTSLAATVEPPPPVSDETTVESTPPPIETAWTEFDGSKPVQLESDGLTVSISRDLGGGGESPVAIVKGTVEGRPAFDFRIGENNSYANVSTAAMQLDGSTPMREIAFATYTGGANCCTETKIAISDQAGNWTVLGPIEGGNYGFSFEDADGNGTIELRGMDGDFVYRFASRGGSYPPPRIFAVREGRVQDVTGEPHYRPFIRRLIREMEERAAENPPYEPNGYLAGWVAAKAIAGEFEEAWAIMMKSYDRNATVDQCLDANVEWYDCPTERRTAVSFPRALGPLLVRNRYIPAGVLPDTRPTAAGDFDLLGVRLGMTFGNLPASFAGLPIQGSARIPGAYVVSKCLEGHNPHNYVNLFGRRDEGPAFGGDPCIYILAAGALTAPENMKVFGVFLERYSMGSFDFIENAIEAIKLKFGEPQSIEPGQRSVTLAWGTTTDFLSTFPKNANTGLMAGFLGDFETAFYTMYARNPADYPEPIAIARLFYQNGGRAETKNVVAVTAALMDVAAAAQLASAVAAQQNSETQRRFEEERRGVTPPRF